MAPRAFWKGYLKLSLVTCPVAMSPATSLSERVRFHTINRTTGNRVRSRYVDSEAGEAVEDDDQVKGYPVARDTYVMVEDEELESVALETTHTIDIARFVPAADVDRIQLDAPHFLFPDDPVGEEAFSVIREAMSATGTAGLSRLVLHRRERSILITPRGRGLVVWTIRPPGEIRDEAEYFSGIETKKLPADLTRLAESVMEEKTGSWDTAFMRDQVQENLLKVIEAKKKGRRLPKAKEERSDGDGKVVNIMDALKRSLDQEKGGKPRRKQ